MPYEEIDRVYRETLESQSATCPQISFFQTLKGSLPRTCTRFYEWPCYLHQMYKNFVMLQIFVFP